MMESTDLFLVCLLESKYYHTGTMLEYLEVLTGDKQVARELNFEPVVCTKYLKDIDDDKGSF